MFKKVHFRPIIRIGVPDRGFENEMKKILFIDDEPAIGEMISLFLSSVGYQVKVAHDGEEGIEFLKNGEEFNAVITDIKMPTLSGNDVARYVREAIEPSNIHLVAISGMADDVDKDLFDSFLEKPFRVKELLSLLRSA